MEPWLQTGNTGTSSPHRFWEDGTQKPQLGFLQGAVPAPQISGRSFWLFISSKKEKQGKTHLKTKGPHSKPPSPNAEAVFELLRNESKTKTIP